MNGMDGFDTNKLYRYIYERKGKYYIRKNNKSYGSFNSLENAMLDRDLLEICNWDQDLMISLSTVQANMYKEFDLPPFKRDRLDKYRLPKYITRYGDKYRVQKYIEGELCVFGDFSTLHDALVCRDSLVRVGWDVRLAVPEGQATLD